MQREPLRKQLTRDRRRRLAMFLLAAVSVMLVLALTADVWARSSGGRYGGRAGFSQSRSGSASQAPSPTNPSGGPTYHTYPSPVPSPGFGFFPFFLPFFGWGGGMGGGFGLGGIFGLLIILGIVVVVGRVLLQNLGTVRRYRLGRASKGDAAGDRYAVITCQLGLFSTARSLQRELQDFAQAAVTDTVAGLATALQEVVIALTRHREYWKYGSVEVQRLDSLDGAERAFNQAVNQERAKLSEELTLNIDGLRRQAPLQGSARPDEVGRYLVVTLLVATSYSELTTSRTPTVQELEGTVQRLGTLLASDLLGVEVIWSPENPDDSLTEDELLAEYPELSGL
ncbi:MAG: DUF1517 domain-containing protein [Nitrospinae bacterium]|nr:DUF1517 domain-containing protein [Nitrospinota bacterium]